MTVSNSLRLRLRASSPPIGKAFACEEAGYTLLLDAGYPFSSDPSRQRSQPCRNASSERLLDCLPSNKPA